MNPNAQITAEIIAIGDELLFGQTLDTNSQWIGSHLSDIGVKVTRQVTIGDRREEILKAFEQAEKRAQIVLITGGLGPTNDDLTKPCLTEYFNTELVLNTEALAHIEQLFAARGRTLTELNREQALLPKACTMVPNRLGTAPGMWFLRNNTAFVSMPGVPYEMKTMMQEWVLPRIQQTFNTPNIYHRILRTVGVPESLLANKIKDWEAALPPHIRLAYLPGLGQVRLRLTATGSQIETLKQEVAQQEAAVMPLIGKYVFGFDEETLEEAIGRMLLAKNATVATAESCTGGNVAHRLTSIAGSSAYFMGSVVAYHNHIKQAQLGVQAQTLEAHGAVSEETVIEMANGVRQRLGTTYGLSTSGVAGPGGGSPEKPVGTVWTAVAGPNGTTTKLYKLTKDRTLNIQYGTTGVLNLLRQSLNEND